MKLISKVNQLLIVNFILVCIDGIAHWAFSHLTHTHACERIPQHLMHWTRKFGAHSERNNIWILSFDFDCSTCIEFDFWHFVNAKCILLIDKSKTGTLMRFEIYSLSIHEPSQRAASAFHLRDCIDRRMPNGVRLTETDFSANLTPDEQMNQSRVCTCSKQNEISRVIFHLIFNYDLHTNSIEYGMQNKFPSIHHECQKTNMQHGAPDEIPTVFNSLHLKWQWKSYHISLRIHPKRQCVQWKYRSEGETTAAPKRTRGRRENASALRQLAYVRLELYRWSSSMLHQFCRGIFSLHSNWFWFCISFCENAKCRYTEEFNAHYGEITTNAFRNLSKWKMHFIDCSHPPDGADECFRMSKKFSSRVRRYTHHRFRRMHFGARIDIIANHLNYTTTKSSTWVAWQCSSTHQTKDGDRVPLVATEASCGAWELGIDSRRSHECVYNFDKPTCTSSSRNLFNRRWWRSNRSNRMLRQFYRQMENMCRICVATTSIYDLNRLWN